MQCTVTVVQGRKTTET